MTKYMHTCSKSGLPMDLWVIGPCDACQHVPRVAEAPTCDDCCASPCSCDPRWKWITDRVREAGVAVTFCTTENGNIGVFLTGESSEGSGDTAEEAVDGAIRRLASRLPALSETQGQ